MSPTPVFLWYHHSAPQCFIKYFTSHQHEHATQCHTIRLQLDIHVSSPPPPPPPEPPPWGRKLISLVIKAAAYFATL